MTSTSTQQSKETTFTTSRWKEIFLLDAGGGRKVIRCELSLDGGDTWRLADIQRHEKATPYNKYWCWVFWSVEVPSVDLLRSSEIRVRAVDSSNNLMPEKCASS